MDHKKFLKLNGRKGQAGLRKKLGNTYNKHMSALASASHKNRKKKDVDNHPIDSEQSAGVL